MFKIKKTAQEGKSICVQET